MKFVLGILTILASLSSLSQTEIKVLYIDAHHNAGRLNKIIFKAKEIVDIEDKNTLLYIANGSNPFKTTSGFEFHETLNVIKNVIISSPEFDLDIIEINRILISNGWVSNLINEDQRPRISFYFMVEESDYSDLRFEKNFINYLLLTNNLLETGSLLHSCSVTIILDKSDRQGVIVNRNKSFIYENL